MPRKLRSDSLTAQVETTQTAMAEIAFEWPGSWDLPEDAEKRAKVLALCDDVWNGRDPRDWRETDGNIIAEFALVSIDLSETQTILSECNYLIEKEGRGGKIIKTRHPLMDAAQHLTTRRMALARSLALTGAAATPRNVRQRGQDIANARRGDKDKSWLLA